MPLDPKFQTEDPKVKLGKLCDRGHKWLVSKTISDCLEALIGAYYIAGGLVGALHLMKWFRIDAELESSSVVEAINSASLHSIVPKTANEIAALELKIGYAFSIKGLLLEAMTHPSCREEGLGYCYEASGSFLLGFFELETQVIDASQTICVLNRRLVSHTFPVICSFIYLVMIIFNFAEA